MHVCEFSLRHKPVDFRLISNTQKRHAVNKFVNSAPVSIKQLGISSGTCGGCGENGINCGDDDEMYVIVRASLPCFISLYFVFKRRVLNGNY